MPIVHEHPDSLPYVVYNAPVNEKTQKLREMFKVGEDGYPEHYQWRGLARLGPQYKFDEPFLKFDPPEPQEHISTKVVLIGGIVLIAGGVHMLGAYMQARPWWTKLHQFGFMVAAGSAMALWAREKTYERQSRRNGILIDYSRKHPERFGEVKRYKMREVLTHYLPNR